DNFENNHDMIEAEGTRIILETNYNAPNKKVVEFDYANPTQEHWKDIIPETENVLNASSGGGKIFANYMVDVKTQVKQYDLHGKFERDIELPGIGSAGGFWAKYDAKDLYYSFTSFTYPTSIFKYDIASGKSALYEKPKIDFDP